MRSTIERHLNKLTATPVVWRQRLAYVQRTTAQLRISDDMRRVEPMAVPAPQRGNDE